MKKKSTFITILSLTALFSISAAETQDKDLLFHMNYDNYEAAANYSKGYGKPLNFKGNLMLRMHPGAGQKGNALCYNNGENFLYNTIGNFIPNGGTVSFWVMPKNWDSTSKNFQMFFRAKTPGNFNFYIYKMHDSNALTFAIYSASGKYILNSVMSPKQWIPEKWHKIDAVWDTESIALYIDGELAAGKSKNPYVFRQQAKFPASGKSGWMQIGMSKGWKPVNENDLTVIDDVRIYSRKLSSGEIRAAYEKIFPRQKKKHSQFKLTVPQGKKITADGKLTAGEWDDATVVPLINPVGNGKSKITPALLFIKADKDNIMTAVRVEKSPSSAIKNNDNPRIWQDDCFEIHLDSAKKHRWQFILNSNGALYDAAGYFADSQYYASKMQKSYQSNALYGAADCKNYWTAELVIPKKSLASMQDLTANFGITSKYKDSQSHCCWTANAINYFQREKFGKLIFDGPAVQIKNFTVENNSASVFVRSKEKNSVSYVTENGNIIKPPAAMYGKNWTADLHPGKYMLQVTAKDFAYFNDFEISEPLNMTLRSFPSKKKLELNLKLNIPRKNNVPAAFHAEMIGADGKKITENRNSTTSERAILTLALPENLKSGPYRITAKVIYDKQKFKCEKIFYIPDFSHYNHNLGNDHTVPAPWKNITGKNGRYELTGKEFIYNNGPFPASVNLFGKKLFLQSPALYCNGNLVEWKTPAKESNFNDVINLSNSTSAGRFTVKYKTDLYFDGFARTELEIIPEEKNIRLDDLTLRWSVPAELSKFLLNNSFNSIWKNKAGQKYEFDFTSYSNFYIWLTGNEKGFCFWPESAANILNKKGEKPFSIIRSGNETQVEIKLISKSCKVPGKLVYRMGIMATPGKRFQGDWRKINIGWEVGKPRHETFHMRGFINRHYAKPYPWTLEPWTGLVPYDAKRFKNFVAGVKKQNSSFIPYSQPAHTAPIEKDYDYFITECEQLPVTYIESATEYRTGRTYDPVPLCPATKGAELFLYRADKILADYPELGGLYYDISPGRACSNTLHGHGGIDAFGREYKTSTLYDLRLYFMRLRKIIQKHGKDKYLVLHAHSAYTPFTHGMGDAWWPGEQYWAQAGADPLFYCAGVKPEEYQSIYSPKVLGTAVSFLSAIWTWPMQRKMKFSAEKSPVADQYTISYLTACMLNDILPGMVHCHMPTIQKFWDLKHDLKLENAVFSGYWEKGGYSENTLKISRYDLKKGLPFQHILIIGNIGRKPVNFSQKYNPDFLHGQYSMTDLWNNQPVKDLKTLTVKPGSFLLIGITTGEK